MKPGEAKRVVAFLLALCPAAKIHAAPDGVGTVEVYQALLVDLPFQAAMAAVTAVAKTHRFPTVLPSVAEIREATLTLTHGARRPGGDAWGDVLRAVRRFGAYRTPSFDDPLVARAVAALSWREICTSENQAADRARFVELYDQLAATARREILTGLPAGAAPLAAILTRRLPASET